MCGRFIVTGTWAEYRRYLDILPPEVDGRNGPEPNYNVAITSEQEIVTSKDGHIAIERAAWDLTPHWMQDPSKKRGPLFNARGETVAVKNSFREAFKYGRCLVPATGYYEWKGPKGAKQPYLLHLPGDPPTFEPYAFAGIMARNEHIGTTSFAIITLPPTDNIATIHDRMPVILKQEAHAPWMDPETGKNDALALLQENRGPDLVYHPVGKAVGKVENKGPELIDPVTVG